MGDVARNREDTDGACMGVSDLIEGAGVRAGVVGRELPATELETLRE